MRYSAAVIALLLVLPAATTTLGAGSPSPATVDVSSLNSLDDFKPVTDDVDPAVLYQQVIKYDEAHPIPLTARHFALSNNFTFPGNAQKDLDPKDPKHKNMIPRTNAIFCVDISHFTDSRLLFTSMIPDDISCVYMKATQGVGYKDDHFSDFWSKARATAPDLLVGAYHFLSHQGSGADQAASFVKFLALNNVGVATGDMQNQLPPVVDFEWDKASSAGTDRWDGISAHDMVTVALDCMTAIQAAQKAKGIDKTPILYTNAAFLAEHKIGASEMARLAAFPIWQADYSSSHRAVEIPAKLAGRRTAALWQFAENAIAPGISGSVDANIFKGTPEEFEKQFKLTRAPVLTPASD